MDFSMFLVVAVMFTGAFSIFKKTLNKQGYVEYISSFFIVFLLVLLVRFFVIEPFQIDSNSMLPTLQTGDFVFVNKFIYGLRIPLCNIKVLKVGEPTNGDVIVFNNPIDTNLQIIKRVIGIPGDVITYKNKRILINGHEIPNFYITNMYNIELSLENIDTNQHNLYNDPYYPNCISFKKFFVPENHYFVLGDNRDHSNDSRFWGFVPDSYIIGRASFVWMHWANDQCLPTLYSIRIIN